MHHTATVNASFLGSAHRAIAATTLPLLLLLFGIRPSTTLAVPLPTECPPSDHPCSALGEPGCSDTLCCKAVCDFDPFCCDVIWDSVCVEAAALLCDTTVQAFGVPFTPIGSPTITSLCDQVHVGLAGKPGGVSIGGGDVKGIMVPTLEITGAGDFTVFFSGPFGCISRFGLQSAGDTITVVTDPPCEGTFTAQLLSDGQVVAEIEGLASGDLVLDSAPDKDSLVAPFGLLLLVFLVGVAVGIWLGVEFGTSIVIAGLPGVTGDTLLLIPEQPAVVASVQELEVTTIGVDQMTFVGAPSLYVGDEAFVFTGSDDVPFTRRRGGCSGEGQEVVAVDPDRELAGLGCEYPAIGGMNGGNSLLVADLGDTPDRGIRIDVDPAGPVEVFLGSIPGAAELPTGAGLRVEYIGSVAGTPGQPLGSLEIVDTGDVFTLTPDLSSSGLPTYLLQVYDQGELMVSLPGQTGSIAGVLDAPSSIKKVWNTTTQTKCINPFWSRTQQFVVLGGQDDFSAKVYSGNELRILVEGGAELVDHVSAVTLLAGGFDSLTVLDVVIAPPTLPCPSDLDENGAVDGADLGLLLGAWGTQGPGDLNVDGTIDGADLGLLLGAWGTCPSTT